MHIFYKNRRIIFREKVLIFQDKGSIWSRDTVRIQTERGLLRNRSKPYADVIFKSHQLEPVYATVFCEGCCAQVHDKKYSL